MFAQGLPNQRGPVYPRPFGRSIRGPEQLRIQDYLNSFHTVENSPQSDPQSITPAARVRHTSPLGCNRGGWRWSVRQRTWVRGRRAAAHKSASGPASNAGIADDEQRSLSQVCEILFYEGVEA